MNIDTCADTPIVGIIPSATIATIIGSVGGTVGLLRLPFSDEGARQVKEGFGMVADALHMLCVQFIRLNPYHKTFSDERDLTCSARVEDFFDKRIQDTNSPLMKRVYVLAALPSLLVTRIADLALGALAFIAAIMTVGMIKSVNERADSHLLKGFEIIGDLPVCLARLARPDAVEYKYQGNHR